jgi:hypothetical protein
MFDQKQIKWSADNYVLIEQSRSNETGFKTGQAWNVFAPDNWYRVYLWGLTERNVGAKKSNNFFDIKSEIF